MREEIVGIGLLAGFGRERRRALKANAKHSSDGSVFSEVLRLSMARAQPVEGRASLDALTARRKTGVSRHPMRAPPPEVEDH